jgi:hypothetical protein
MTVLDDAATLIRRRLDELSAEQITLERTLAALSGGSPTSREFGRLAATGGARAGSPPGRGQPDDRRRRDRRPSNLSTTRPPN